MFLLPGEGAPKQTLDNVLRYTHSDRFPAVPGYKTLASHWHYAYTVQALARGNNWVAPFRPVLKSLGIDILFRNPFRKEVTHSAGLP